MPRTERNDGPMSADDPRRMLLQKGIAVSRRPTLVLVVLSIAKGTVGLLSGSIALLADAAHTIMDIAGSVIVWLGLRLSLRKPTDRFPYGFYKAESICALIVCIIMIFTGAEILRDSVERFYVSSAISFRPVVIGVAISSGFCFLLSSSIQGEGGARDKLSRLEGRE